MTKVARKRAVDWPLVVLVAVVGAIAIAALVVLDVTAEKIAAVPVEQWVLVASSIAGGLGTIIAAFRGRIVETRGTREADAPPPGES